MQIQKTGLYRTYIGVFKETYIGPYTYRRTQENTTSIHPKDTVFISVFIVAHMCTQTYLFSRFSAFLLLFLFLQRTSDVTSVSAQMTRFGTVSIESNPSRSNEESKFYIPHLEPGNKISELSLSCHLFLEERNRSLVPGDQPHNFTKKHGIDSSA